MPRNGCSGPPCIGWHRDGHGWMLSPPRCDAARISTVRQAGRSVDRYRGRRTLLRASGTHGVLALTRGLGRVGRHRRRPANPVHLHERAGPRLRPGNALRAQREPGGHRGWCAGKSLMGRSIGSRPSPEIRRHHALSVQGRHQIGGCTRRERLEPARQLGALHLPEPGLARARRLARATTVRRWASSGLAGILWTRWHGKVAESRRIEHRHGELPERTERMHTRPIQSRSASAAASRRASCT